MVDHGRQIEGVLEVLCVGVKYVKYERTEQRAFTPMHKARPEVGGCGPP